MEKKEKFTIDLEKNSLILFFIMMIGNVLNYVFQIVMGKLLSTSDFGTVNALLSLCTVLSTPALIVTVVSSKFTTKLIADGREDEVPWFTSRMVRFAFFVVAAVSVVGLCFSRLLSSFFKIESMPLVLLTFLLAAATCIISVYSGVLQGTKRFIAYGIQGDISTAAKLVGSVVFVLLGAKVFGVLFALILGNILALAYAMFTLRKYITGKKEGKDNGELKKQIMSFGVSAIGMQICSAVIQNGDVLLVKAFSENSAEAGIYSSGAVLGKIALYLSGAVTAVLFPMVAEAVAKRENTRRLLLRAVLFGGVPAILYSVVLNLFGGTIIGLLFDDRYLSAIPLLFPICLLMVPVALVVIEMNYFLALGRSAFFLSTLSVGCVICVVLVSIFHSSVSQMLYLMSGVMIVVFIVNLIYGCFQKRTER